MLKKIPALLIVFCLLLVSSCADAQDTPLIYTYNGNQYTCDGEYGQVRKHYTPISVEEYQVEVQYDRYKEKANLIANDEQNNFLLNHELLLVRTDYKLPTVRDNADSISYINVWFFDEYKEINIRIDKKEDIESFVKIMLEADEKSEPVKDISYDYTANVEVYFENCPVYFFAGRLVKDRKGNCAFSSSINPNNDVGAVRISWYSVPFPEKLQNYLN